ncbi:MAG: hypothetical protein K2X35_19390 [Bryobacteraceae bacterium]|nr:hypothetical protein [Bryobacteraceae bacterium]
MSQPAETPAGAPIRLAAVQYSEEGPKVVVYRFETREKIAIDEAAVNPRTLEWSPDGFTLAYRNGDGVRLWRDKTQDLDIEVAPLGRPFAFSPDSRRLAVAGSSDLRFFTPADVAAKVVRAAWPGGCKPVSLLWDLQSRWLYLLCFSEKHGTELFRVDPGSGAMQPLEAHGAVGLLGWRGELPELIAYRRGVGDTAIRIVGPQAAEIPHGEELLFFVAYVAGLDLLVAAGASEDTGDPARLLLVPGGGGEPAPWVTGHRDVSHLSFSRKGPHAVFVDRGAYQKSGDDGGDLWLVQAGSETERLVLQGKAGERTYAYPALWP